MQLNGAHAVITCWLVEVDNWLVEVDDWLVEVDDWLVEVDDWLVEVDDWLASSLVELIKSMSDRYQLICYLP